MMKSIRLAGCHGRKKEMQFLDARVLLHQTDAILVVVPVGAGAVHCITVKLCVDLGFTLDHLDSETLSSVPCDVAVSEPDLRETLVSKRSTKR